MPIEIPEPPEDLLALDEALRKFAVCDPIKAELVKLRYFAGLTSEQAATVLGISYTTAKRYWAYARAWLHEEMRPESENADDPSSHGEAEFRTPADS